MLKEKLTDDLKTAMKSADQLTVGVLRLLMAAIKNKEIEKRTQLSEEEVLQVLSSEAKKRKDSIDVFSQGGREDLAKKEREELLILEQYLPKQLSAEETEQIITRVLARVSIKEFGPVMKEVMKELKGKADGKLVSEIIKKKLG